MAYFKFPQKKDSWIHYNFVQLNKFVTFVYNLCQEKREKNSQPWKKMEVN